MNHNLYSLQDNEKENCFYISAFLWSCSVKKPKSQKEQTTKGRCGTSAGGHWVERDLPDHTQGRDLFMGQPVAARSRGNMMSLPLLFDLHSVKWLSCLFGRQRRPPIRCSGCGLWLWMGGCCPGGPLELRGMHSRGLPGGRPADCLQHC